MKVFGWIQSKLKYGRHDESNHKPNLKSNEAKPEPEKEEVTYDWLHGLLAIGTFGKNDTVKDLESTNFLSDMSSSPSKDHPCDSVSDNLCLIWHEQDYHTSASASELEQEHSSEIVHCFHEPIAKSASLQLGAASLVTSRGKGARADNKKNGIGKKSLSFLLKKMLVCRSDSSLPLSPKASIPESRTEMIFRAILHRKIYPQSSNHSLAAKKYLKKRNMDMSKSNEDVVIEKATQGSKWVKTDSEYIVLEM